MSQVDIYTRPFCPFCMRARRLLTLRGIDFREIDVHSDAEANQHMQQLSGRTSVPQIFINGHHVGGSDELAAADASGSLTELLNRVV